MARYYQIKLGDCIFCTIRDEGFSPETVWDHSNNAPLREKRRELKKLQPGDSVFIPDPRPKVAEEPTNLVHKFRMKGEKHLHWIEIEMVGENGEPCPNEKYKLKFPDGSEKEGNLDQNGWARIETPARGNCEVTFPKLDKEAWKFIESFGPKNLTS